MVSHTVLRNEEVMCISVNTKKQLCTCRFDSCPPDYLLTNN